MKLIYFTQKHAYYLGIKVFLLMFLLTYTSQIKAQETLVASGNNESDTGGSVSYSVGQIIHVNSNGSNGSSIKGIQFHFDSSALTLIDIETNLNISTYPNPTTSVLNMHISNLETKKLQYILFGTSGKTILKGKITNETTKINVERLETATYFLKVNNTQDNTTKIFKIIKN